MSAEAIMPGFGRKYEFIGKQPPIFTIVAVLFIGNTFLTLGLDFFGQYLFPKCSPNALLCTPLGNSAITYAVPETIFRYTTWSLILEGILVALFALVAFLYRKDMRQVR
jgi:hypothetical protein